MQIRLRERMAAAAACDNVVDVARALIWRGSVEEATAGGGAAQAGQPLLALLPLKPAAEQRGRQFGLAKGAIYRRGGALEPMTAAVHGAMPPAAQQSLRDTRSSASGTGETPPPATVTVPHPAACAPVVVRQLLPRLDVVAGKEDEALAAAHHQDLGVQGGRARVVLRVCIEAGNRVLCGLDDSKKQWYNGEPCTPAGNNGATASHALPAAIQTASTTQLPPD